MCGIVGILARGRPIPPQVLEQATLSLAHRGPDDSGTVLLQETRPVPLEIGLGHRRLAILDLSPLGHQPMKDPVTSSWIVFNGEIYNFRSLCHELEATGAEFKSHSDTEVILAAYRVWGESFLSRLEGMFALAIWDAPRKRLLLARDPMGIKPLYYHHSDQSFIFASEVRTILGTGIVPRKLDSTGVLSYLAFGSVYEPWTIIEGIKALAPGHLLTLENGILTSCEYWSPLQSDATPPKATSEAGSESDDAIAIKKLPAILRDAVLSNLVSDVPVGVFLSGGIDSSAIVAVLSRNGVRASTFSLVFKEEEFNEAQYSRAVAHLFGTDHHEISVSQQDTLQLLPAALSAMDQPTIDGINTYLVSAKTREAGMKVALTGLGADEMFAGYSNFRRVPKMETLSQRFGRLPGIARRSLSASLALVSAKGDRNRKLAALVAGKDSAIHPYFLVRTLFGLADRRQLFSTASCAAAEQSLDNALQNSVDAGKSLDPINRVSYLESVFYMRNTLLRDSDFMSMAHGLELRVPFLEKPLVEACFRISGERKTGDKKLKGDSPKPLLLASLGVDLPSEIIHRPKRGFTLPLERWLRGEMRPLVERTLLENNWNQTPINAAAVREVWNRFLSAETSWSRPWSLFVLARWCELNL